MKQLTVLGSTGSIGCSTLDVVRHNPGCFSVAALVAGKNVDRMVEQCLEFTPRYAVMDDAQSAERLRIRLHEHGCRTEVLSGQQAAAEGGNRRRGGAGTDAGGDPRRENRVVGE